MPVKQRESALRDLSHLDTRTEFASTRDPIKVLFLGANFDTGNHGVSALASGTIASLYHAFENPNIDFLDYGREPLTSKVRLTESSVSIGTILLRFSKKPWQANHIARLLLVALLMRLVPSKAFRAKMISSNPWLERISQADISLAISGGDSFSDIYGMKRLLYIALPQVLVLWLNKPLVLLPQTHGPFEGFAARFIARYILRRAKIIYSRDAEGINVVNQLLGHRDTRVKFAFDMGFALQPFPPAPEVQSCVEALNRCGTVVGLNASGLLYMGGYTKSNMFGLKTDYSQTVRAIIECLIVELGCQVLLVPHVFGAEIGSESDVQACREILREFRVKYDGKLHFIDAKLDHQEVKWVIGRCDFFLGSRMHACIAALSQCVPAVGLAYSRKFDGVLESIGGGSRVVDLRGANLEQVLGEVRQAFKCRKLLGSELRERMPRIRKSVLNLCATQEFNGFLCSK